MNEAAQPLTSQQAADLRRQFREREASALESLVYSKPMPPLPSCPACGAAPERVDQREEDPQFGVYETALLTRWMPCGHRFRAVVDLSAGPVRP